MVFISRTDEFRQILGEITNKGAKAGSCKGADVPPMQAQSALNALAAEIGAEIQHTFSKVQELKRLSKKHSKFNDRTEEMNKLSFEAKQEIQQLSQKVKALEDMAAGTGPNRNYRAHSTNMVQTLKVRLRDLTRDLPVALEACTKAIEEQEKQRQKWAFCQASSSIQLPSEDRDRGGNASVQQTQLQYVASREAAVKRMRGTIAEVAALFQRMVHEVAAQDEVIHSVHDDVEAALDNVEQGQSHLLEHYKRISENRSLICKVFLILIFFVVFFVVFLA